MKISDPKAVTEKNIFPCIKECFKDNLKSLILYGSAVSDSFNAASSDINILLLLDKNIADSFMEFGKKSKKIIRKYRLSVLILTFEEFVNSADVFPMEYYDIYDHHVVIYGESIEGKLKLTSDNLRHQLEERLRGFSNQFRQVIIQSNGSNRILKQNIKIIRGVIKTLMRSALRLKEVDVKNLTDKMIFAEVEKKYGVDMSVFSIAPNTIKHQDMVPVITKILEIIDKITVQIDKLSYSR
jgi:predicted nucleotidyltransferase